MERVQTQPPPFGSQLVLLPKFEGVIVDLGTKTREMDFRLFYRSHKSPGSQAREERFASGTSPLTKRHRLLPQENVTLFH